MSYFQRMIAIPQEEYLQLSTVQNARQPMTQQFYNLDKQYNREAEINDPYKRLVLQTGTLEDMKRLKDQMRHYLSVSTPKPYRTRAQALLENVSAFLRFNERGEIYNKENELLENTRLEDLIQHAVRDRRRNINPTGWSHFLNLLREHNVPKSILNRGTLDEMEAEDIRLTLPVVPENKEKKISVRLKRQLPISNEYISVKKKREETPKRRSSRARRLPQRVLESFEKY